VSFKFYPEEPGPFILIISLYPSLKGREIEGGVFFEIRIDENAIESFFVGILFSVSNIGFNGFYERYEIIFVFSDQCEKFFIGDKPVSVDERISEIKKGFYFLREGFRKDCCLAGSDDGFDISRDWLPSLFSKDMLKRVCHSLCNLDQNVFKSPQPPWILEYFLVTIFQ